MYDQIKVNTSEFKNAELKALDTLSKDYFTHIKSNYPYKELLKYNPGNFYIQFKRSPLKVYMWIHYPSTTEQGKIAAWGKSSSIFADYGMQLIKEHPLEYLKYFMLLNTRNYFLPHLEKLELYNLGSETVPVQVQDWFDFKVPEVWAISKTAQGKILIFFPSFFLFLNLLFMGRLIFFLLKKTYLHTFKSINTFLILSSVFLLANFCFTVFATINVLRYQVFPMVICFSSSLLLIKAFERKKSVTEEISQQVITKRISLDYIEDKNQAPNYHSKGVI